MSPLRLHHRIVIPFVLAAVLAMSATALLALSVVSRSIETASRTQAINAAEMMSHSDFALNQVVLQEVRQLTGADVVTFKPGGAILASTLERAPHAALVDAITGSTAGTEALASGGEPIVRQVDCNGPCYVAYRQLLNRPDTVVALVESTAASVEAGRTITRSILIAAALSLLAMSITSQIVVRRVTAPIDALVSFARDVSLGASHGRAKVTSGDEEVGRLAQAFNEMLDRLDQSQQALVRSEKLALAGLIAARVAHDVRNPLSAIKMQTQLLKAKVAANPPDVAMVDAVLHDIATVESVVQDLIELARPGDLRTAEVDLNHVVELALTRVAPQFAHRRIRVETHLDPLLPRLLLDIGRFRQALLNVIINAADAMPTGGLITIGTSLSADGLSVIVDVSDDGVGIDPAVIGRVFDPFVSTKRDGVGLGLVNAKAVVESHGGRISLEQREPRGARARIEMPAVRQQQSD